MKPDRIGGLADGIFAIAMTLLVLDIHVPQASDMLRHDVFALAPKLLTLVISFVILAIYWSSHHMLTARITKSDFRFMWRNIWFLLPITIVPFVTALLGEYPYAKTAQIAYAGVLILCGVLLYAAIYYAVKVVLLMPEMPSLEFRRNVAGKILIPPVVYLLAIGCSFWNTHISLVLLILGPLSYFISIDSKVWTVLTKPFAKYIV